MLHLPDDLPYRVRGGSGHRDGIVRTAATRADGSSGPANRCISNRPMNFDQGEFDLSGNGSDEGYRKWLRELDANKRAFESRHGVVIGRRVRVRLVGESEPMEGMIYLVAQKGSKSPARLRLRMGKREFSPPEIESMVRLDEPPGE